jgi:hypothetical protein
LTGVSPFHAKSVTALQTCRRARNGIRYSAAVHRAVMTALACVGACLAGCEGSPKPSPPPAVSTPAPGVSALAPSSPPAPSPSPSAPLPVLTPSRWEPPDEPSKPPTSAEWLAAPEIEVKNAKRLGCELKLVREWIRASCRTSDLSASQVKGLRWIEPATKTHDSYELVKPGTLASIVLPIRRQTRARVEFEWSDFSRVLSIAWSPDVPKPAIYFSGDAPRDLSKPDCLAVCGIPYFPGRGSMRCPDTHDPTDGEDNGCICRKYRDDECSKDW